MRTRLTDLLALEQPVVQAPPGIAAGPVPASWASASRAPEHISASFMSPADLAPTLAALRPRTSRPPQVKALALDAGRGVWLPAEIRPATTIVDELVVDAESPLRRLDSLSGS